MADYYPLISRAVAGLEKNSGEARRAVYERARAALLAQLRGVTPALNESDITRERLALEEAIRKVEAESARRFVDPSKAPPPKPRASEPPQWEEPARPPRAAAFRAAPPPRRRFARLACAVRFQQPQPRASAAAPDAAPSRGGRSLRRRPLRRCRIAPERVDVDQPLPQEPISPPPSRHPLRRPERHSLSDAGLKDFRNVVSEANELGGASARATRSARDAYAAVPPPPPPAPSPEVDRHEPQFDRTEQRMLEQHEVHERPPHEDFPEPMLEPSFTVDETRPAPPKARRAPPPQVEEDEEEFEREEARPPRSYGGIIRAVAAFVIVACLAGVVVWQWSNMVALYRVFRAPSTEVVTRDPPPTAQRPAWSPAARQETRPGAGVAQKVCHERPSRFQGNACRLGGRDGRWFRVSRRSL